MSIKLALNPGHNMPGGDPGAIGNGLKEAELNTAICNGIAKHLVAYDVGVTTICENDLALICSKANDLKADYFLSVHCNAGNGEGFESYTYADAGAVSNDLRRVLHTQIMGYLSTLAVPDRGMKVANFAVLRDTNMPAALLECLFVDSAQDAAKLKDAAFIDGLSNAIAWGIVQALSLVIVAPDGPVEAIRALQAKGVIASPDYWLANAKAGKQCDGAFVAQLLRNMAKRL